MHLYDLRMWKDWARGEESEIELKIKVGKKTWLL